MSMGSTIKFILTYKEAFWKENNFSGEFISQGSPITWMADITYQNQVPTLVGFLAGHNAISWSQCDEEDLKVAILDQLSLIFGEWALEPTGINHQLFTSFPLKKNVPITINYYYRTGFCNARAHTVTDECFAEPVL